MTTYTPEQLRRIDALVAEKVMEWIRPPKEKKYDGAWTIIFNDDGKITHLEQNGLKIKCEEYYDEWYWKNPEGKYRDYTPEWSENIIHAWMVVEKMRKYAKSPVDHNGILIMLDDSGWYCEFPAPRWEEATCLTAPLAICLAALKAVGVNVEKELE